MAGCAHYAPKPLDERPAPTDVATLRVSAAAMPMPALRHHRFDPGDGLDITETAMLAVANNPHLRVLRDRLGVARAQAFDAGLLPDPQLSASLDRPSGSDPALTHAFGLGLSMDLGALLTRSARVTGARATQRQVRLDLLWAEWQTIAQARRLFDQVESLRAQQQRLQREATALHGFQGTLDQALREGNLDYAGASAGLDAVANVRNRLADTTRQLDDAEHALRLLLGLAPDAPLHLTGPAWQPQPTMAQVKAADAHLARRRPDLLALQAGYAAQEAQVRTAILGQFPDIQVGFNRARDTSNVYTSGISVGLSLPLFNRNRGQIAIARATRQSMADDYRERLLSTRSDMHRLLAVLNTLDAQIKAAQAHARQLDRAGQAATARWHDGTLDWPTWLTIRASALDADLQLDDLRQQRATASIALETLLGGDWSDAGRADVAANQRMHNTDGRP
ncbi:TolC family protein [Oleiagrimonas soli]|uniref:Outer membrane protein TolC n=1 Tax=Oleiagrimonas soli TaxID=1543381 RepID=A0A841KNK0_9GAMM|nr:TolC family protein [Oleiagrimonas soli]MBB6183554.1 outer membrane protein TolC [Oleiagrimonas soli]